MGLINWIFDFYQHSKISEAKEEAIRARAEISQIQRNGGVDGDRLERALGELALATKTIQRLMVEKKVCSQNEFIDKLKLIDAEDGNRDGLTPV